MSLEAAGAPAERAGATEAAMREGREVIHQGCFCTTAGSATPDFLIRVDEPSELGDWSYEVHDAKLGEPRQAATTSSSCSSTPTSSSASRAGGPQRMHLVLGDGRAADVPPEDFAAYAARVRAHFEDRVRRARRPAPSPPIRTRSSTAQFCPWWKRCATAAATTTTSRSSPTLQRGQGLKLEAAGVHTVGDLAALPAGTTVPRLAAATLDGLREQADLQVRSRGLDAPLYELLEPEHGRGLARLPAPSAGDVFFDFEGDP